MDVSHRRILTNKCDQICETVELRRLESYLKQLKLFNKYMWEDINSMQDVFELLPTRGPEAFKNFIRALKNAGLGQEAKLLEDEDFPDVTYRFSSKPKGVCLLINNYKFDDNVKYENRVGAENDDKSLSTFFESIGYEVFNKSNLTCSKMKSSVKSITQSSEKWDVVIVILMSHGSRDEKGDFIVGTDGIAVYKETISEVFNNYQSPHLQGKPKMFFFIACRGKIRDLGVPKYQPTEYTDSVPCVPKNLYNPVPEITDMLKIHSTLPGQVSVRDDFGTWFCQDFIHCLYKYYKDHDIEEILKTVNSKLTKRVSDELGKQVLHIENIDFKKLYLCGLRNND